MNKFRLEEVSNKAEILDGLMLSMGESIFHGKFNKACYEMAFHHLTVLANEIKKDLADMVEESFSDVDIKEA